KSLLRKLLRLRKDDGGAALLYVTITIPVIFAITSLAVDVGYVFYLRTKLQTAADMGALAGASKLYTDNAQAVKDLATTYVNYNLPTDWTTGKTPVAVGTPEVKCLTTITNMGLTCSSLSGGNALKVTVTATTPLFFATALGFKSITLSADSLVSGGGSSPPPLNVAIVLDATASMNSGLGTDCGILKWNSTKKTPTKIQCASLAAKTLLTKLWSSVDQVALYTYPSFDAQSIDVVTCKTGNSGKLGQVLYTTAAKPNYQMFDFTDNYMDTGSPPTGGLKTDSPLVLAMGKSATTATSGDQTNCNGLDASGLGIGTSIADAIAQAQSDLIKANQALVDAKQPKRQNVLIVLSDGDANGNSESLLGPSPPDAFVAGTDSYGIGYNPTKWVIDVDKMSDQCQAAVAVADAAAAAGTWVYSIAFSASNTAKGSCFTDRPYTRVTKTKTSSPALTSADNIVSTWTCSKSTPCKKAAAAPDTTVTSTIAAYNSTSKTQVATTTWGETSTTTCTKADGSTSGTCTVTLTPSKVQKDTYDLSKYDITACKTMQDIASDASKFYSTDGGVSTNGKCPSAANPNFTDLVSIFNNVAASIMKKRRIPSGTT
ncbi:pilus assembly protein TadG-related protein, partial [Aestuariivirga sp.]|uniref:pilus assembly protein TadG-related protein n=1 Tax=Aestuariivirga sp. TaxID=2650926 RepID=UPI0035B39368